MGVRGELGGPEVGRQDLCVRDLKQYKKEKHKKKMNG